ncbi:nuclear RNA export factor 2-like [Saccopteryx bilineata]|uniref:nuclear RNA export factor 2-like n=1 Tax=Saccopteryx bilineata TaxID=59482 RepID=UPI00338E3CC1
MYPIVTYQLMISRDSGLSATRILTAAASGIFPPYSQPHGRRWMSEDRHGVCSPRGRMNWNSFRDNFGRRNRSYPYGGYELQTSHFHKDNENVEMRDVQNFSQLLHSTMGQHKRRVRLQDEGSLNITVETDRKSLEREIENSQEEITETWFKIIVPYGGQYDKTWLIHLLQSHCSVSFTPVDFHYVKNRAQFFVQDASAAYALRDVSYKIRDEENRKIPIFINNFSVPHSVQHKLEPKEMEQLKLIMSKRYDVSQKSLDLQCLRFDPGLACLEIEIILNRRNCMAATLQIIEKSFPELLSLNLRKNRLYQLDGLSGIIDIAPTIKILNLSKNELNSACELEKIKGLKLKELWLEGNPLCGTFPDQPSYISAIRKCFPELLRLDGQDLSPPNTTDTNTQLLQTSSKEKCQATEMVKNLILQFLQQYYLVYDSGDRQSLLGAYDDEACFSLTIPFNPEEPDSSSLFEYLKDNRNMKNIKDPNLCFQLLKHTKHDIVCSLCRLPKTQHDTSSFVVDMWLSLGNLLCFSIYGVFKEVEGKSQGSVRAFTRTFIVNLASNSGAVIMNDELFVKDITPKETPMSIEVSTPSSSSGPTLSQKQQEMVQVFSIQSGMNLPWSEKCLQENDWNYTKAAEVFIKFKTEGTIPEEAFK